MNVVSMNVLSQLHHQKHQYKFNRLKNNNCGTIKTNQQKIHNNKITIQKVKGSPPRHKEEERKRHVEDLDIADEVLFGNQGSIFEF